MLSGIGPAADLAPLMIPVRVDLPVGEGLQDHPSLGMSWHSDTEGLLTAASPANAERLKSEGRGPLTSNIAEACGFFRTREGLEAPDIQINAVPANSEIGEEGLGVDDSGGRVRPLCSQAHEPGQSVFAQRRSRPEAAHPPQLLRDRGG